MLENFFMNKIDRLIALGLGLKKEDIIDKWIYEGFIWDSWCSICKLGRFVKRLWHCLPILYNMENWDLSYVVTMLDYHLKSMEEAMLDDDVHPDSKKLARQVRIVREHIYRYYNSHEHYGYSKIQKDNESVREWLRRPLTEEESKHVKFVMDMENKHWHKIWSLIEHYGQGWGT